MQNDNQQNTDIETNSVTEPDVHRLDEKTGYVRFEPSLSWLTPFAIKGALLMIVTFGIYRFWMVTDLRRNLWNRTSVAESSLEYTGRASELLIGFLIALAILLPIYLMLSAGSFVSIEVAIFFQIAAIILIYLLTPFALYRARKYRLGRTVWRGVRFHQAQSGIRYAFIYVGGVVLWMLSLGLAGPWIMAYRERYLVNNSWFGKFQLHSRAHGRLIAKPYFIYYAVIFVPLLLSIGGLVLILIESGQFLSSSDSAWVSNSKGLEGPVIGFIWAAAAAFLLYPYFFALKFRAFAGAVNLGGARLSSNIDTVSIYIIYITYFFSHLFVLLPLVVPAAIVFFVFDLILPYSEIVVIIFVYAAIFVTHHISRLRFLAGPMWLAIAQSVSVINVSALDEITQSDRSDVSGTNEGFADALDVGGGFDVGL